MAKHLVVSGFFAQCHMMNLAVEMTSAASSITLLYTDQTLICCYV